MPNLALAGSESVEQQRLFLWWRHEGHKTYHLAPQQLFAIPNGGKRSKVTAARLKAEGAVAGIPDVFLACPQNTLHGLFLELKRPKGTGTKGRVSEAQKEAMKAFHDAGYACVVAYGYEEARKTIENYLKGELV